ncbi:tetratricopeptide repeat protein [Puniceibacterium confluentis]|uniref:tetratricopeptide repeat protein n=1 Tax=Puniceibacterium confluentis TaxID=1958944 RepID=UPI001FE359BA|nr:tetratricopeptide repeat protein [Puniceibacterium confluentis]
MKHKSTVAALFALVLFSLPLTVSAQQTDRSEMLLRDLAQADAKEADRLEKEIRLEWSKSGSAAVDLLLKRGRDALEINDVKTAIEHFTALTDHAPAFAEGWHGLALAYYQADRLGLTADALEHTLALNPQHFGALRGLGALFDQLGKPALAYDAYSRVLEIRPHDPDVEAAMKRLETQVRGTEL